MGLSSEYGAFWPAWSGNCFIIDTLFWKVNTDKKIPLPVVVEKMLTPKERVTWQRIKEEPESLLEEEEQII